MNYNEINRKHWDEATKVHIEAPKGYYDIDGFDNGKSSLKKIHLSELGDLKGKRILHLLCHIGLDTLSLARLGAEVVGVDISQDSVDFATELASLNKLNAKFICSDVYDLNKLNNEKYDIVFASHGVTCWLKNLNEFMNIVSNYLKPDGFFYLMDGHPISIIMANDNQSKNIKVVEEYFEDNSCPKFHSQCEDYANKNTIIKQPIYEWRYTLSEIINSVCQSGLTLTRMNEHSFCDDNYYSDMIQDAEGWWKFEEKNMIPLMFSIKAVKKVF